MARWKLRGTGLCMTKWVRICARTAETLRLFVHAFFQIIWGERQRVISREKRDYFEGATLYREKLLLYEALFAPLSRENSATGKLDKHGYSEREFNDELWDREWYLVKKKKPTTTSGEIDEWRNYQWLIMTGRMRIGTLGITWMSAKVPSSARWTF